MSDDKKLALSSDHGLELANMGFMVVKTLEDALKISDIIAKSEICPKNFQNKPGDVLVAIQMGAELGLKPIQALQNIAVINGRPSIWGDAMLAICRQSKQFEFITERYTESTETYTCIVKRKNEPEFISTFSRKDADLAGLWSKQGPWKMYPKRMLQLRARGFCLRDSFPDLLRGIITAEEARDYPGQQDQVQDYSQAIGRNIIDVKPSELEKITADQVNIILEKVKASGSDLLKLLQMLKISNLEEMPLDQFELINGMLDKRLAKLKPKELATDPETGEVLPEGLQ